MSPDAQTRLAATPARSDARPPGGTNPPGETTGNGASNGAKAPRPAPPSPTLGGVRLALTPDTVVLPLASDPTSGPGTAPLRSLYHVVTPAPGLLLSLTWETGAERRPRRIRLSVAGDALDWRPEWATWVFARRRVSDLRGGDAASGQDVLSEDGTALTLLLLPDDLRREATLEFRAPLGPLTHSGDHIFTVSAADVDEPGLTDAATGAVRMTNPPPRLLEHLPALYQEAMEEIADLEGAGGHERHRRTYGRYADPPFFVRYLRGIEDIWEPLQTAIGRLYAIFGTETAPAEFIPWLAQWVALSLDENWPELRRRRLIREAVPLFAWRGTKRGLTRYLEIYAGVTPEISDQPFSGMRLGDAQLARNEGVPSAVLGSVPAHTFVVTITHPNPAALRETIIRAIIESQKPAHTRAVLQILPLNTPPARDILRLAPDKAARNAEPEPEPEIGEASNP